MSKYIMFKDTDESSKYYNLKAVQCVQNVCARKK